MAVAAWLGFPLSRSPLGSLPRRRLPVFAGVPGGRGFLTLGAARQVASKGFRIGAAPMPTLWAAGALRTPGDLSTVVEPGWSPAGLGALMLAPLVRSGTSTLAKVRHPTKTAPTAVRGLVAEAGALHALGCARQLLPAARKIDTRVVHTKPHRLEQRCTTRNRSTDRSGPSSRPDALRRHHGAPLSLPSSVAWRGAIDGGAHSFSGANGIDQESGVPAHPAGPSSGAVVEPTGRRPRREHHLEARPAWEVMA